MFDVILGILVAITAFLVVLTVCLIVDRHEHKVMHNACQQENDCEFCKYYYTCYVRRELNK